MNLTAIKEAHKVRAEFGYEPGRLERGYADRILVMYEGEIVGELDPKKTTVEELGLYMAGAKRGGVKA